MKKKLGICGMCGRTFGTYDENTRVCQQCNEKKRFIVCPVCGLVMKKKFTYSEKDFLKETWECENCGTQIKYCLCTEDSK